MAGFGAEVPNPLPWTKVAESSRAIGVLPQFQS
jgi:hypothetical protein